MQCDITIVITIFNFFAVSACTQFVQWRLPLNILFPWRFLMTLAGIPFVLCVLLQDNGGLEYIFSETYYEGVLISPQPDLLLSVVGWIRKCCCKEGSVHVPNCKSFLVTEVERKHVRQCAQFQQRRDVSCHQVFFFSCKSRHRRKFTSF